MVPNITHITDQKEKTANVFIVTDLENLSDFGFTKEEKEHIGQKNKDKTSLVVIPGIPASKFVRIIDTVSPSNKEKEELRVDGYNLWQTLKKEKQGKITIYDLAGSGSSALALAEGVVLASYSFDKYKTKKDEEEINLMDVYVSAYSQAR